MPRSSEADLIAEARSILGADEEILGAGYFGLANLRDAMVAGGTAGGLAVTIGSDLNPGIGTLAGSLLAVRASAEEQGVTVKLLVAITPDTIHVLNQDTDGRLRTEVVSFRRDHVTVDIQKVGLSRRLTLTDPDSGVSIELHGSVSWLAAQSTGDKVVLALLQSSAE